MLSASYASLLRAPPILRGNSYNTQPLLSYPALRRRTSRVHGVGLVGAKSMVSDRDDTTRPIAGSLRVGHSIILLRAQSSTRLCPPFHPCYPLPSFCWPWSRVPP